jgi:arylsulfatase
MQGASSAVAVLGAILVGCAGAGDTAGTRDDRPNVLLIVADDLGYADLGVYGGDIRTPTIDALATEGVLFTQFHASPLCAITRAMLLSGNNNHVAGLARQGGRPGPVIPGLAGYENTLSDRVAVLPRLLREAGYRTYMAGKWHLGEDVEHSPWAAGFDRSFAMKFGAGNHFDGTGMRDEAGPKYFEDAAEVDWPDGAYSTAVYTDRLIGYLDDHAAEHGDSPFFMYAAYTSPHWPLQVPDEDLDLYAGRYDQGYDRLREERFASLQAAGIVAPDAGLPPRIPAFSPFDALDPATRRRESRKLELYAAMVDNLDRHVGRLLDAVRAHGLWDDTLVVFMADNGAAGEDFYDSGPYVDFIRAHYDDSTERMGRRGNWVSYGPQWAEAGSAPFRLYKGFATEGGLVAPMIVTGPGVGRRGETSHAYVTVMDLMPTFLDLAGAAYPDDRVPMRGESARAFLAGEADAVHDDAYVTILMQQQRAFIRRGDWKLVSNEQPFDERAFALYNVAEDPGETTDLSETRPDVREALVDLWRAERRAAGIVLPEDL